MALRIKPYLLSLTALLLFYLSTVPASACSCGRIKPCEAYAGADTVFVGLVMKTKIEAVKGRRPSNAMSTTFTNGGPVARLRVEEAFRGIDVKEIEMSGESTTCDYYFEEGQRYLVYAYRSPDGKIFYTNICSGTSPISKAKEHLAYLRATKNINAGGTFQGDVRRAFYNSDKNSRDIKPYINVEVILESGQSHFQTTSDKQGKFKLSGLPQGRYKVHTNPQTNFSSLEVLAKEPRTEWEVDIPDHGCVSEWFQAKPTGEITGQIIGKPTEDMWVEIMFAKQNDKDSTEFPSAEVDEQGRFRFTFLPAGKYLIGFNMTSGPFLESPYPEFYYPNVTERARAGVITLGENEKLSGLQLPLPSRLAERTIEGVAVWPDGRPAVDVSIELHNPRTGWREGDSVQTDSQGRFAVVGMEGQTYQLSASVKKGVPLVNSKPIIVKLEKENKPVKLVIEIP